MLFLFKQLTNRFYWCTTIINWQKEMMKIHALFVLVNTINQLNSLIVIVKINTVRTAESNNYFYLYLIEVNFLLNVTVVS